MRITKIHENTKKLMKLIKNLSNLLIYTLVIFLFEIKKGKTIRFNNTTK